MGGNGTGVRSVDELERRMRRLWKKMSWSSWKVLLGELLTFQEEEEVVERKVGGMGDIESVVKQEIQEDESAENHDDEEEKEDEWDEELEHERGPECDGEEDEEDESEAEESEQTSKETNIVNIRELTIDYDPPSGDDSDRMSGILYHRWNETREEYEYSPVPFEMRSMF